MTDPRRRSDGRRVSPTLSSRPPVSAQAASPSRRLRGPAAGCWAPGGGSPQGQRSARWRSSPCHPLRALRNHLDLTGAKVCDRGVRRVRPHRRRPGVLVPDRRRRRGSRSERWYASEPHAGGVRGLTPSSAGSARRGLVVAPSACCSAFPTDAGSDEGGLAGNLCRAARTSASSRRCRERPARPRGPARAADGRQAEPRRDLRRPRRRPCCRGAISSRGPRLKLRVVGGRHPRWRAKVSRRAEVHLRREHPSVGQVVRAGAPRAITATLTPGLSRRQGRLEDGVAKGALRGSGCRGRGGGVARGRRGGGAPRIGDLFREALRHRPPEGHGGQSTPRFRPQRAAAARGPGQGASAPRQRRRASRSAPGWRARRHRQGHGRGRRRRRGDVPGPSPCMPPSRRTASSRSGRATSSRSGPPLRASSARNGGRALRMDRKNVTVLTGTWAALRGKLAPSASGSAFAIVACLLARRAGAPVKLIDRREGISAPATLERSNDGPHRRQT